MAIQDQDRFFNGGVNASVPKSTLPEGTVARVLNGRFVEGAITNAIGFEELELKLATRDNYFASAAKYSDIFGFGDVQLVAPLENIHGKFLIAVISGVIFKIDLTDNTVTDITPRDAFLPDTSKQGHLSYIDNGGGVYGVAGYLVIFNYPNKTIFITPQGARLANQNVYEAPPFRMGATAGNRLFAISADNIMYASDPLGGYSSLAPLTFQETLDPTASYYGQTFSIGSVLNLEYVTSIQRLPRYMSVSQDFLAQQLLVSTKNRKYLISSATNRDQWDSNQFIAYAGSSDGIAGPLSATNVGDILMYISTSGRIKTIGQDQERDTAMAESFLDDALGQYLGEKEVNFYHRDKYKTLDHSRGLVKFINDRVYATVYPIEAPAIDKFKDKINAPTHRALAVGSLDSTTQLGATASIVWEGFYDWLRPIGLVTLEQDLYVCSKNEYGAIKFYKQDLQKNDEHKTVIYTRAYFANEQSLTRTKSLVEGSLYFRRLCGTIRVSISYLVDDLWVCGADCETSNKLLRFSIRNKCKTEGYGVPLKIEIWHNGNRFELESIKVAGEVYRNDR